MSEQRLIDANALDKEVLRYAERKHFYGNIEEACIILKTRQLIDAAPAVDAEVVRHGYWIPQDNTRTKFMCSDCKSRNHDGSGKYCSLCGCKMDAEI